MFEIELYPDAPIDYHEYDPRAPTVAEGVVALIVAADARLGVEHVGSSAVPGCSGKGYIDLLVMYPAGLLATARQALADLGFQHQVSRDPFPEERPMRVGSVLFQGKRYSIHAHVVAMDSPEVGDLLWFRDRLRADKQLRADYEAHKQRIVDDGVRDARDYTNAKAEFIQRVLAERRATDGAD